MILRFILCETVVIMFFSYFHFLSYYAFVVGLHSLIKRFDLMIETRLFSPKASVFD